MISDDAWVRFTRQVEERIYDLRILSPAEITDTANAITEDAKRLFESQEGPTE